MKNGVRYSQTIFHIPYFIFHYIVSPLNILVSGDHVFGHAANNRLPNQAKMRQAGRQVVRLLLSSLR
ncbi:MAG: hypothetical protein QG659_402 [Patescibacteria group bacterium]|jgi:hypothetical protein|nr:hypothetical protein [Patescibacteria group bacterium]